VGVIGGPASCSHWRKRIGLALADAKLFLEHLYLPQGLVIDIDSCVLTDLLDFSGVVYSSGRLRKLRVNLGIFGVVKAELEGLENFVKVDLVVHRCVFCDHLEDEYGVLL
jgi:hypothetical protein